MSEKIEIPSPQVAITTLAENWFMDALQESRSNRGPNARRREIVFSMLFLDSYLSEVTDDALEDALPTELADRLTTLTRYRDYLTQNGAVGSEAVPELDSLEPGWALLTVIDLVEALHQKLGTPPPDYILTLNDPLLALAGSIKADVSDLAERHDHYLAESIADTHE